MNTARHVKSKNEPNTAPPLDNRVKEKMTPKSRPVVYSSESEESPSKAKNLKKKLPAKPKATATVAPVVKPQRPVSKAISAVIQQKQASSAKAISKLSKFPGKIIYYYILYRVSLYSRYIFIFLNYKKKME